MIAAVTLGLFEVLQPTTAGPVEARPVFDALVTLVEAQRAGTETRVTLHLEGGAQLSGVIADLSGARGGGLVLVDGQTIHVVDPGSVIAVTVPNRESLSTPAAALTKLDLQRRAEELGRSLGEMLGGSPLKVEIGWKGSAAAGLPENGERLAIIAAALDEAAAGIRLAAAGDDFVRKDLARRLKRVKLSETPRAGASFSGDTLSIGIAPSLGAAGRASSYEIERALSR